MFGLLCGSSSATRLGCLGGKRALVGNCAGGLSPTPGTTGGASGVSARAVGGRGLPLVGADGAAPPPSGPRRRRAVTVEVPVAGVMEFARQIRAADGERSIRRHPALSVTPALNGTYGVSGASRDPVVDGGLPGVAATRTQPPQLLLGARRELAWIDVLVSTRVKLCDQPGGDGREGPPGRG